MEIYNVVFDAEKDLGVYAISLVHDPAMESEFVALNKQEEIRLAEVDSTEYILAGVALIPNKDVYRNQKGKEYYLRFTADVIKEVAHSFIKNGFQGNSTIEHQDKIEGVSIVQSWVVRDPENDTANAYNLPKEDIKKGSWIVLYKCDNKEVYDKALSGEIKGFSIDGLFDLEKVNFKKSEMIEEIGKFKDEVITEVKALFSKNEEIKIQEVVVNLGMATLKDGETKIEFPGETMNVGDDIFIVNGEDKAPLPVGQYELENETKIVVSEDGKIGEIMEMVIEEELKEDAPNQLDEIKKLMKELNLASVKETKSFIDELKEEFELKFSKQNELIEELKKTPMATPIKSAPVQMSKASNINERLLEVINKNKK